MASEQYEIGKNAAIQVSLCSGNLTVRGRPGTVLMVKGDAHVVENDLGLEITAQDDLVLHVPEHADVKIGQVQGNLVLKYVAGECRIVEIQGDARIVGASTVQINHIHGDLVAKKLNGDLVIGEIHGDLAARTLAGITADVIQGDFAGRQISGPVRLAQVQGDISLRGGLGEGQHALKAHGDIVLRWPAGRPLLLSATGAEILNRLQWDETTQDDGKLNGRIGEGKTVLDLEAGGRIILKEVEMNDEKWDMTENDNPEQGFEIHVDMNDARSQIEAGISRHMAQFARQMESKFGPEFGQHISEKVARKAEKAAKRAERTAEKYQRRAETRDWASGFGFMSSPTPPTPPPSPAKKTISAEEQLKILKMVESGSITSEEADMLLEALGA